MFGLLTQKRFEDYMKSFRISFKHELRGEFATKTDLQGLATKADMSGFVTKDDLSGFATKDDLSGFATKDDHQRLEEDLRRLEVNMATKDDVRDLGEEITKKFSDLQTSIDHYQKTTETWHQEFRVLKNRHDRLSTVLINKRIAIEQELAP